MGQRDGPCGQAGDGVTVTERVTTVTDYDDEGRIVKVVEVRESLTPPPTESSSHNGATINYDHASPGRVPTSS